MPCLLVSAAWFSWRWCCICKQLLAIMVVRLKMACTCAATSNKAQQMERWQDQAAAMRQHAKLSSLVISSDESPQEQASPCHPAAVWCSL